MKLLFENWRDYNQPSEQQLLVEGRIDVAKKKFPKLSKTSDLFGAQKSRLDQLVQADPSGNQKYLVDAARILNHEIYEDPNQLLDGNRITLNLIDYIEKYHKLHSFIRDMDAPFRDLGNVDDFAMLRAVVDAAEKRKEARGQKKISSEESAKKAREESREIFKQRVVGEPGNESIHPEDKTKNYIVRRPETEFASCRYGQGTRWCISSDKHNEFDNYTRRGYAFYFVDFANLPSDNDYKRLAIAVPRDLDNDIEIYDAQDTHISSDGLYKALMQNLLNLKKYPLAYEWTEPGQPADYDKTKSDYKKAATDLGLDYDKVNVFKALQSMAREQKEEILDLATRDAAKNPAGPQKEDFEAVIQGHDFKRVNVEVLLPWETNKKEPEWEINMILDLAKLLDDSPFWWVQDNPAPPKVLRHAIESSIRDIGELYLSVDPPLRGKYVIRFWEQEGSLEEFKEEMVEIKKTDDKMSSGQLEELIIRHLQKLGFVEKTTTLKEIHDKWRKFIK